MSSQHWASSVHFDLVAVWPGKEICILERVGGPPYNHPTVLTVDWAKNVILWILGGLVDARDGVRAYAIDSDEVTVSLSAEGGQPALPAGDLPFSDQNHRIFYVHLRACAWFRLASSPNGCQ
jgi:hypothetical protein